MDDKNNRGPQDRSRINMHEDYEVQYWTKALGVSKDKLAQTVSKVGNSADAVRKELAA
jgi:3-oxoacyl-[acyl-carrier-protein] synthase III